jgi:hypothetical protein
VAYNEVRSNHLRKETEENGDSEIQRCLGSDLNPEHPDSNTNLMYEVTEM